MENRGSDWRTILLGISSLGGSMFAFAAAALILVYTEVGLFRKDYSQTGVSNLQDVVIATGIVFIGAVFLPASYFSVQRLRGKEIPLAGPKLLKAWQGLLLILIWAASATLAQLMLANDILKWFTPIFYILAIVIPVYFLLRLASGGLNTGSHLRFWGAVTTSIALGTTLSIIAEMLLVFIGLATLAGFLALHPEQLAAFKQLTDKITNASDIDSALNAFKPWLNTPLMFLFALIAFSVCTPIIEETAKSLTTWTVFDHLDSPAQGFVIGALSGAGFGLVESLLASASPDSSWAATLMIRGGSTMMHVMTASLTGWGIGSLRSGISGGRPLRIISMYALAIFLHGSWNAAVVMIAFGGLRSLPNATAPDLIGMVLLISGISILIILCITIPLALWIINKRLRKAIPLSPASVEIDPSNLILPDEIIGNEKGLQ